MFIVDLTHFAKDDSLTNHRGPNVELGSVHTTPDKFINRAFTMKTHHMFSISHFGFVFEENSVREITYYYRDHLKSSVFKVFSVHTKTQSRCFQIPPV